MQLQASFFQLFALGLLVASTVALAQKVFELYNQSQKQIDEVKDEKIRGQVLKNSPEKNDEFFVDPKVID